MIDESHVAVPQVGGMYEGDMSRKRNLVDHGFRLPSAMDNRPLKWEEFLDRIGQTIYLSATPGNYELDKVGGVDQTRRADHPAHRPDRPRGRRQADQGPDRRPDPRDPDPHRAQRAGPGHHAHQEDVRGPHRLPPRRRRPDPLPALRGRHAQADRAAARPAAGGVRRPGRHQPAPRGPRPARGLAGVDPRRRQGGLPALRQVADPDHRPGRAQRVRAGAHVRRQDHPVDGVGHRRDQPASGQAGGLQHRARPRPAAAAQEDRRHHRDARPRGREHRGAARDLAAPGPALEEGAGARPVQAQDQRSRPRPGRAARAPTSPT